MLMRMWMRGSDEKCVVLSGLEVMSRWWDGESGRCGELMLRETVGETKVQKKTKKKVKERGSKEDRKEEREQNQLHYTHN